MSFWFSLALLNACCEQKKTDRRGILLPFLRSLPSLASFHPFLLSCLCLILVLVLLIVLMLIFPAGKKKGQKKHQPKKKRAQCRLCTRISFLLFLLLFLLLPPIVLLRLSWLVFSPPSFYKPPSHSPPTPVTTWTPFLGCHPSWATAYGTARAGFNHPIAHAQQCPVSEDEIKKGRKGEKRNKGKENRLA